MKSFFWSLVKTTILWNNLEKV